MDEKLWKITGDGQYFAPFYINAGNIVMAIAIARDILAGANPEGHRFYCTVESHIIKIETVGKALT